MEDVQGVFPARPPGLGDHPLHQVGVALGVEHDHHVAPGDVLGDQDFRQPGLADAGGAEHQGVADAVAQGHVDRAFLRLDAMDGGLAADIRQRADRVPPGIGPQPNR